MTNSEIESHFAELLGPEYEISYQNVDGQPRPLVKAHRNDFRYELHITLRDEQEVGVVADDIIHAFNQYNRRIH